MNELYGSYVRRHNENVLYSFSNSNKQRTIRNELTTWPSIFSIKALYKLDCYASIRYSVESWKKYWEFSFFFSSFKFLLLMLFKHKSINQCFFMAYAWCGLLLCIFEHCFELNMICETVRSTLNLIWCVSEIIRYI